MTGEHGFIDSPSEQSPLRGRQNLDEREKRWRGFLSLVRGCRDEGDRITRESCSKNGTPRGTIKSMEGEGEKQWLRVAESRGRLEMDGLEGR